ncbi:MAG: hypothetical protein COU90_00795 [Candidatus Ryanbacteria bacterium CG10_big_fil_rev_8_21_14_0_10_43_42]|uniref:dolichyl-phosphate beta-glucosyltransferase n=1 Tax=Candidatus Ryanbacteria bacterium CG10_big_fil_rev_8_21_14_0_10_43_42 TaxID=1974864 RepID=A0A2M8KYA5_9BACT|nr:MAG: hypothetical protein COU90_00795 [Candidatus Ryanbacteria bacterium CG10_big_fil_rev_8_21_14_0_10_43_42]
MYLSVIVPAYNEEDRIVPSLQRMGEYLSAQNYTYEIVVVVDGAKDHTADVVRQLTGRIAHLRLIEQENTGKGGAVTNGMRQTHGRIRLFTDADNSTDIHYFEDMRPLFDEGRDLVISTRHSWDKEGATQKISQPWYRRILGMSGNIFIQIVAVPGIWDTQNGFKAFTSEAATRIFGQTRIKGFGFDIEILAMARHFRYTIGIIPIEWQNDDRSTVGLSNYINVLMQTIQVRWNIIRGIYK